MKSGAARPISGRVARPRLRLWGIAALRIDHGGFPLEQNPRHAAKIAPSPTNAARFLEF
jgi:hypothetical protein